MYTYIYIYIYVHMYIYIYIYRERERGRGTCVTHSVRLNDKYGLVFEGPPSRRRCTRAPRGAGEAAHLDHEILASQTVEHD